MDAGLVWMNTAYSEAGRVLPSMSRRTSDNEPTDMEGMNKTSRVDRRCNSYTRSGSIRLEIAGILRRKCPHSPAALPALDLTIPTRFILSIATISGSAGNISQRPFRKTNPSSDTVKRDLATQITPYRLQGLGYCMRAAHVLCPLASQYHEGGRVLWRIVGKKDGEPVQGGRAPLGLSGHNVC